MSILGFIVLLIIAGICGALAEALVGFSPGGFLVSIAVGLIGAFLGTWLAGELGLPPLLAVNVEGQQIYIVWTVLGSMLLLLVLSLLRGGRRRRYIR
ncbi:MAG: hypothetical protein KatS3mg057_2940 [Herpetosiphonaceae bacterium]|nr:MAG: hypothetical protein KatS3mg057_2940 [Herpetosiphonaceae bacterium]